MRFLFLMLLLSSSVFADVETEEDKKFYAAVAAAEAAAKAKAEANASAPATIGTDGLPQFKNSKPVQTLYADGLQIYLCRPDGTGYDLYQPLATLYSDKELKKPVGLHYGACNKDCKDEDEASPGTDCQSDRKNATYTRKPAWSLNTAPYKEIHVEDAETDVEKADGGKDNIKKLALRVQNSFKPGTAFGEVHGIERTDVVGGNPPEGKCHPGKSTSVRYRATYKFYDTEPALQKKSKPKHKVKSGSGVKKS
ncbi:MAG TPA: DUF3455 domain-containing protein [Bacteriovoracaceae bacterium]|nr:DUF3455 domain-containing protein [Bacteriovoracaceae bacterium]